MSLERLRETCRRDPCLLLSFIIPLLIWLLAYGLQGAFPFGERHILTVDLYHQYAPFLAELRRKLLDGSSLFFSFGGGLGVEFWSLLAYYAASPLNLLFLIVPASALSDMIFFLTLIKLALASLSFYVFLTRAYRRRGWLSLALASAYACSGYMIAFSWNIMWLDCLLVLPWVMLNLVRWCEGGRLWPYLVSLSFLLMVNYYSAFFACIFLALMFPLFWERFSRERTFKSFCWRGAGFALASIWAVALAAVILLPSAKALALTSAAADLAPTQLDFFDFVIDFSSRFLTLSIPAIRTGMANLYLGVSLFLFVPVYFSSPRIPFLRKMLWALLAAFLILSLNNTSLNYYWHGRHYPNQLPFRFSYVVIIFFLLLVYEAIPELRYWRARDFYQLVAVETVLLLLLAKMDPAHYPAYAVGISILWLLIYAGLLGRIQHLTGPWKADLMRALALMMILEIAVNCIYNLDYVARTEYYGLRRDYAAGDEAEAIRQALQDGESQEEIERLGLVRSEILPIKTVNDDMLYGTQGLSIFSSSIPKAQVQFFADLGYHHNGINSYTYSGSNVLMDALFGIRQLLVRNRSYPVSTWREKLAQTALVQVYRSETPGLAYLAEPGAVAAYQPIARDGLRNQARLIKALSGVEDIYRYLNQVEIKEQGVRAQLESQDKELIQLRLNKDGAGDFSLDLQFPLQETGEYILQWDHHSVKTRNVVFLDEQGGEHTLSNRGQGLAELGQGTANKKLHLRLDLKADAALANETIRLQLACVNQDKYHEFLSRLQPVHYERLRDGHLLLKTTGAVEKTLMISTPPHPGWTARIDGQAAAVQSLAEGLMAIDLGPGDHTVQVDFEPLAWRQGLYISLVSALGLVLALLGQRMHRCRKKQAVDEVDLAVAENWQEEQRGRVSGSILPSVSSSGEEK